MGSRTSNLEGSRYGDRISCACSLYKATGTLGGRGGVVPSDDGVFGVNDVSEGSINHGTRGCKEEVTGVTEEKYLIEHLDLVAACCHIIIGESKQ
jgi:hypothetical protein